MEPEIWVAARHVSQPCEGWYPRVNDLPWASEKVTTWVTANKEMASSVHTKLSFGEETLHDSLEGTDVCVLCDQVCAVRVLQRRGAAIRRDVSPQAPRIIAESISLRIGRHIRECRRGWAKVDSQILERAAGDAAATDTSWDGNIWVGICGDANSSMVVVLAIAAYRSCAAVEKRSIERVEGILSPVDVRLVAGVVALIA